MSKSRIFIEVKMQNYLIVKSFLHFSLTVDAKLHPPKSRGTKGSFGHQIWGSMSQINSIPLNILRFRAKTMPQIKRKRQGLIDKRNKIKGKILLLHKNSWSSILGKFSMRRQWIKSKFCEINVFQLSISNSSNQQKYVSFQILRWSFQAKVLRIIWSLEYVP